MGTGGRGDRPIGTMEAGDECIKVGPLFFRFPRGFSLHLSKFSQRTVGVWFRTCCASLRFVPDGLRRQSYQGTRDWPGPGGENGGPGDPRRRRRQYRSGW